MSDNVKNANQRLKILYLYKIFLEMTDEEHYITMPEIIRQLESYGISAGRKALYEDLRLLKLLGWTLFLSRDVYLDTMLQAGISSFPNLNCLRTQYVHQDF